MTRSKLLIGISAVALTTAIGAGSASAQQNTNNQSGCNAAAPNNNVCTVTQGPGTQENSSDIAIISGTGNNVAVDQSAGTLNASTVRISGNNNSVSHTQTGALNVARTDIAGNTNSSTIRQDGNRNSAAHNLNGNNNQATTLQQGGGLVEASLNSSTITTNGNRVSSTVDQSVSGGVASTGNRAVILTQNAGVTANGTNNAQTNQITQSQRGNSATIANSGGSTARGTGAAALGSGELRATITQQNTLFGGSAADGFTSGAPTGSDNPSTENQAVIRLTGLGHSATVNQNGVQNNADVNINRGTAGVGQAAGIEPGTGLTVDPTIGSASGGNSATINQIGRANRTLVSMGFPVGQGSPQQGLGNRLTINSTNLDPSLQGHSSTVYQFGQLSTVSITQNNNTVGATVQGNSNAFVSQGAFFSTLTLTQNGSNDADLNQSGGRGESETATPAANGTGGQSGNNTLTVSQTDTGDIGGTSGTSTGNQQPGAFDPAPTPTPGTPATVARNFASASQAGRNNSGTINQFATRASATLFQRRGSANLTATINQGTGAGFGTVDPDGAGPLLPVAGTGGAAGATRVTARINQGGLGGLVDVRQAGSDLTATVNQNNLEFSTAGRATGGAVAPVVQVSQVGARNNAEVTQNGSNSTATVDQRNTNTGSNTSNVIIGQNGGSVNGANTAVARQTRTTSGTATIATGQQTGPGSTTDAATRGPGTYTNEIEIRQTNDGTSTAGGPNSATVEQRGSGQIGRIFQTGSNNEAGILQEMAATNSTAIITQTGRNNTFFITQDQPNSFLRVTQNGVANQTVLLGSGGADNTGGTTSADPAGRPAFTPTP